MNDNIRPDWLARKICDVDEEKKEPNIQPEWPNFRFNEQCRDKSRIANEYQDKVKQLEDKLAASESENFAWKNQTETLENRISEMNSSFQAISKEWETKIAAVELTKRELIKDLSKSIKKINKINKVWYTLEEEYKQKLDTAEADAKTARDMQKYKIHSFYDETGRGFGTYVIGCGKTSYADTLGESVEATRKQAEGE
jgi:predicted RNase H-like nuclease (RuvC/YqgF family)